MGRFAGECLRLRTYQKHGGGRSSRSCRVNRIDAESDKVGYTSEAPRVPPDDGILAQYLNFWLPIRRVRGKREVSGGYITPRVPRGSRFRRSGFREYE